MHVHGAPTPVVMDPASTLHFDALKHCNMEMARLMAVEIVHSLEILRHMTRVRPFATSRQDKIWARAPDLPQAGLSLLLFYEGLVARRGRTTSRSPGLWD
jgi:hypothetical protein